MCLLLVVLLVVEGRLSSFLFWNDIVCIMLMIGCCLSLCVVVVDVIDKLGGVCGWSWTN